MRAGEGGGVPRTAGEKTAPKRAREGEGDAPESAGGRYKSGIIKQFHGNPQQNSRQRKFQSLTTPRSAGGWRRVCVGGALASEAVPH
jgi:hypothetical protein